MPLKTILFVSVSTVFCLPLHSGWAEDELPLGLGEVPYPETNAPTKAGINLGQKLFFDKLLSRDGTVSCATCHVPDQAFAHRGEAVSKGIDGKPGRRNAPSLLNVAFATSLFLDGRSTTLEDQAWEPILAGDEMGNRSKEEVLARLGASHEYVSLFREAFGVERPDEASVAKALANFQRTLVSGNSPFDKWNWGDSKALSKKARAGYNLFAGQAQCWQCHPLNSDTALMFTDNRFHDTGVSARSAKRRKAAPKGSKPHAEDLGRFEVTKRSIDRFKFKTPSLRNVALTPPYMHDGSIPTMKEVVRFYNLAEGTSEIQPMGLNESEVDALVAFLESLTGDEQAGKPVENDPSPALEKEEDD